MLLVTLGLWVHKTIRLPRLLHLGAVRLHQIRFEHEFLVGSEIDFGVEGFVSRQGDGNFAVAGGDDQAFGDAAKLGGVTDELSVEKDPFDSFAMLSRSGQAWRGRG